MSNPFMTWLRSIWFWILSAIFLLVFFGWDSESIIQTFYFLCFLLPVILGTSYYVNEVLIPKFLIRKSYGLLALYSVYTFIVSLYLQYFVIVGAIYIFSFYTVEPFDLSDLNIANLNLSLYLLIFVNAFVHMYGIYIEEKTVFDKINLERKTQQIIVRYNRTNYPINVSDILYIESLADYIKIVLVSADEIVTKEKISHILERLPSSFLRIHRSFIINVNELKSYNKEFVSIGNTNIPISRTYKKMALKQLESL